MQLFSNSDVGTHMAQVTAWQHSMPLATLSFRIREKISLSKPMTFPYSPFWGSRSSGAVFSIMLVKLFLYSIYGCYSMCPSGPWQYWYGLELTVFNASLLHCIMGPVTDPCTRRKCQQYSSLHRGAVLQRQRGNIWCCCQPSGYLWGLNMHINLPFCLLPS